jgi:hypothetical protein
MHPDVLQRMIENRLARRRYKDLAEVVDLIRENNLEESYADSLPASLRADFMECLEEIRRDDAFHSQEL